MFNILVGHAVSTIKQLALELRDLGDKTFPPEVVVNTKRILLIDDQASVREVVQMCLEDIGGWQVLSAASGLMGLALAVSEQPDAIVLDISMPGMSGFIFIEKLRLNPLTQSIPVVLLSAKALWYSPEYLEPLGVMGAIGKPFNPIALPEQIAKALGWTE
jgi:CheY-like chemotaxis protein